MRSGTPGEGAGEILPLSSISPEAEGRTHPTFWVTVFTTQLYFNYINVSLIALVLQSFSHTIWSLSHTVGDGAAMRGVDIQACLWPPNSRIIGKAGRQPRVQKDSLHIDTAHRQHRPVKHASPTKRPMISTLTSITRYSMHRVSAPLRSKGS